MANEVVTRFTGDLKGLRSAVNDGGGLLDGFAGKAAGAARNAGLAIGVAVGASATKGLLDSLDEERLGDQLAVALNIDPAQGAERADAASKIWAEAWGESAAEVGAVMAGLGSSVDGLFGDELDDATRGILVLGEAFDVDVNGAIQASTQFMKDFGIDADEAIDGFSVALGNVPANIREELFEATNEYGKFFDQLGFTGGETLQLLSDAAADGGVFGIDKFGDAIKELTIRSVDGSKASLDAYEAIGIGADLAAERMLLGGENAAIATNHIIEGLLALEDPVEQANAAVALFGEPLNDLGTAEIPAFLESLSTMSGGFDDVAGANDRLAETLSGNALTRWESFKRRGLDRISDAFTDNVLPALFRFEDAIIENWPQIQAVAVQVWTRISTAVREFIDWFEINAMPVIRDGIEIAKVAFAELAALAEEHWPQIQEIIILVVETVQAGVERFVTIVQGLWERFGDRILSTALTVWNNTKEGIGEVLDIIQGVFGAFKALFEGDWSALWENVKATVTAALALIETLLDNSWELIKLAATVAWDLVKEGVSKALSAISGLIVAKGTAFFTAAKNLFFRVKDGITDALKTTLTAVTDWFSDDLFGKFLGYLTTFYTWGVDMFTQLGDGVLEALKKIPGYIKTYILDELEGVLSKVGSVVNAILGIPIPGGGGGDSDGESSNPDQDLLDAVAANSPTSKSKAVTPNSAVLSRPELAAFNGTRVGVNIEKLEVRNGQDFVERIHYLEVVEGIKVA